MAGRALIFSAPSGSGKTTIVKHLLDHIPSLKFSISATTRPARGNEQHGVDYFFLTAEEFKDRIKKDELLEFEEVYQGRFYGTLNEEVDRIWQDGNQVVFDVDVVGGAKLKRKLGSQALAVFIKVPDEATLRQRLSGRGTDSEDEIEKRLSKAAAEMEYEQHFDVSIVNDELEDALIEAESIVKKFIS